MAQFLASIDDPIALAGAIAGSATVASVVTFGIYDILIDGDRNEDPHADIEWGHANFEEPPPQPRFNKRDSTECVLAIEKLYSDAVLAYDEKVYKDDRLNESYRTILAKKAAYGFSFINNDKFLEWSVADFDQTYEAQNNPDAKPPELTWDMKNVFIGAPNGSDEKNLDTEEDIDRAMSALFWYR